MSVIVEVDCMKDKYVEECTHCSGKHKDREEKEMKDLMNLFKHFKNL